MYRLGVVFLLFCACSTDYSGQITLQLDAEALNPAVRRAMDDWERLTGLDLFVEGTGGVRVSMGCDHPDKLGWTDATYSSVPGGMTGTIQLCADVLAKWPAYADPAVAHELGHTLRLEHVDVSGNIMNPKVPREWAVSPDQLEQVRETTHL